MKQQIVISKLFFTVILVIVFTFSNCKKSDKNEIGNKSSAPPENVLYSASLPVFEPNTSTWNEIVQGQDDTDTRIGTIQLYFSIGLKEIVKDPVIASWIYDQTKSSEEKLINFDQLFTQFPETKVS